MKDPDNLQVLEQHTLARHQLRLVKQEEGQAAEQPPERRISRETNCLDACLACQSTVSPLLLSIIAHCTRCGAQRPCLEAVHEERQVGGLAVPLTPGLLPLPLLPPPGHAAPRASCPCSLPAVTGARC
jgi:hypothetical protein